MTTREDSKDESLETNSVSFTKEKYQQILEMTEKKKIQKKGKVKLRVWPLLLVPITLKVVG